MSTPDHHHLADIELFSGLSETTLAELAARCEIIELPAGEVLFAQGDTAEAFYRIEEGQIHITRQYDDHEEFTLETLSPYETVGEMSMIAEQARAVTATAVSDCVLLKISNHALMSVCDAHPELTTMLLHRTAHLLAQLHLNMHSYAIGKSAPEARLASMLLLMSDNRPGEASTNIRKHQLARAIGVDFVWVDTMLNDWAIAGHISMAGSRVDVINVSALQAIAGVDFADY